MALSSSISKILTRVLILFLCLSNIEVRLVSSTNQELYFDWYVSFQEAAPLGVAKQIIVINDQFPGPLLNASTNDFVNINIHNNLDEPFLMTWNGIQMRRNPWQDGVRQTNCPINPGQSWTYSFQLKDQVGSYFYFPSLQFHKAAGGYGAIRIQNSETVIEPFPKADYDYDILIGDWYNANHRVLRNRLENSVELPLPDGVLINGLGPHQASMDFQPGKTYRLRISNVGLRTTLNFRIQEHPMLLVETEGTYTIKKYYDSLDIHVGQSYSVLVTANTQTDDVSFYMVATSRFLPFQLIGACFIRYSGFQGMPILPPNSALDIYDYSFSMDQALSIRMDLSVGSASPNPQGPFHYGTIQINRLIILRNDVAFINGRLRYTVNGVSFLHPVTPLMLSEHYHLPDEFGTQSNHDTPDGFPRMGVSVINGTYHDFVHVVFQNPLMTIQSWHSNGYSFFVVGMGNGTWDMSKMDSYNMFDAIYRSTVQVYPVAWTAILIKLDNAGIWNLRSQTAERWHLGQELYIRVKGVGHNDPRNILSPRDAVPIPRNVLKCGRVTSL